MYSCRGFLEMHFFHEKSGPLLDSRTKMKAIGALVFATFFLYVPSSNSEEAERRRYPVDYELFETCGNKGDEICDYGRINNFPTGSNSSEEELHLYCSFIVPFMKCFIKEFENCMGYNNFKDLSLLLTTYEKACDKDSSWNKVLRKHMKCIESKLMSYNDTCLEEENRLAESFAKLYNINTDSVKPYEDFRSYVDFKTAFKWSCYMLNIEVCGEEARTVSEEILKSFDFVLMAGNKKFHSRIYSALNKIGLSDKQIASIKDILHILEQNSEHYLEYLHEE